MLIEEQGSNPKQVGQDTTISRSKVVAQTRPTRTTSPRKVEANRRNAQRSTGPKTPEGKAKSSQNSITHGIFVTKFLNGAAPETVAEIEALAAGIREHCQPVGILEEILVQKIVVETSRYDRVLARIV
jgi:phage protein D